MTLNPGFSWALGVALVVHEHFTQAIHPVPYSGMSGFDTLLVYSASKISRIRIMARVSRPSQTAPSHSCPRSSKQQLDHSSQAGQLRIARRQITGFRGTMDRVGKHFAIPIGPVSFVICCAIDREFDFVEVCRLPMVIRAVIHMAHDDRNSVIACCVSSLSHCSVRSRVVLP
jgi:hypothetical protein